MADAEKVTKEELEWVEQAFCDGSCIARKMLSLESEDRLRLILSKCPTREESPNESTCREIKAAVRAAYARQQEPTKAEQVAFAAAEFVRKASTFLTDNVPTYGAKPGTLRADSDGRWQIKDSSGRVVAEGFPRKAAEQATPAPETNPPIGGKAWSESDKSGGYIPEGTCLVSRAELERAAAERKALREELARTKAALASAVTLDKARVVAVHCDAGRIWADIAVGGLVTRVKGGAK